MSDTLKFEIPASRNSESDGGEVTEHDPHYEPIVKLPLVNISTNEEDEEEMCKIRARLYRFDKVDHEWKERGTGDVKLLRHNEKNTVRVVMRRDKTLKLCANHFITADIQLNPHIGSDRAFNWTTFGDFADETAKQEFLAIKFGNVENATLWKTKFTEAQEIVRTKCSLYNGNDSTNSDFNSSKDISNSEQSCDISQTSQKDNESLKDKEANKENIENEKDIGTKEKSKEEENTKEDGVVIKLSELSVKNEEVVN